MQRWRWLVIGSAAVTAVIISVMIGWGRGGSRLENASAFWAIIGGVVSLWAILVPWASTKLTAASTSRVHELLEQLAVALDAQWHDEAEVRGITYPDPLPLRWSIADRPPGEDIEAAAAQPGVGSEGQSRGRHVNRTELSTIANVVRGFPSGRVVIIGDAGTGKTVIAIQLTRELLRTRRPGDPVPVLLPIGLWNPDREHLHTWISSWLERTYPALQTRTEIPGTTVAEYLVKAHQILPIMDGLDEMPDHLRVAAFRALNRTLPSLQAMNGTSMVLTCRSYEYGMVPDSTPPSLFRHTPEPLAGATVFELLPLQVEDIKTYLHGATPRGVTDKWQQVFAHLDQYPSGQLAQSLSTPLMASIARAIYSQTSADPAALIDSTLSGRRDIERHLLDLLGVVAYERRPTPTSHQVSWTGQEAVGWLSFLARRLKQENRHEFAWWELVDSVPSAWFWLAAGLFAGAVATVVFSVGAGLHAGLAAGPLAGAFCAVAGKLVGLSPPVVIDIRTRMTPRRLAIGIVPSLLLGLILGAFAGVASGVFGCLALAVGLGIVVALEYSADVRRAADPRSVLKSDRAATLIRAAVGGGVVGLLGSVATNFAGGPAAGLVVGVAVALAALPVAGRVAALAAGLVIGVGVWCTQGVVTGIAPESRAHLPAIFGVEIGLVAALMGGLASAWGAFMFSHVWLAARRHMPWRIIAFLDDARHRGLLRQVGPNYQFRHVRLQEHLASWSRTSETA